MDNLYTILGLKPDADDAAIDRAYRKLSAKHHPDKGGDSAMFHKITEARDTLKDPLSRAMYDHHEVLDDPGKMVDALLTRLYLSAVHEANDATVDIIGLMQQVLKRSILNDRESIKQAEARVDLHTRICCRLSGPRALFYAASDQAVKALYRDIESNRESIMLAERALAALDHYHISAVQAAAG